jgi:GTP-binding protein
LAPGDRKVLIRGGKGGRGNQHFATASRQAPRFAQPGQAAPEYDVLLELKLIADAGLVGLPNAGKSSLLAMATNANPKIAAYHFTTLAPNLGVVRSGRGDDYVLADIPGLVEGASQGVGLGHAFLRHVERTRVLVHVVDASGFEYPDVVAGVETVHRELESYSPALRALPLVLAANKTDLPQAWANYLKLKAVYEPQGLAVYPVSAATGQGLDGLLEAVAALLRANPAPAPFAEEGPAEAQPAPEALRVEKKAEGSFEVSGIGIDKMLGYTHLTTERGLAFFQKFMRDRGVIDRLVELGARDGDTVRVGPAEYEFYL